MVDVFKVEKEVMEKYGLSREDLLKITPYKRFVELFGEPPRLLGEDEPEWEYVISYPVEAVYADIADWNSMMAFRELLQNALDGAEEVGCSIKDVKVYDYNGFLVIENPSKKIVYKHLKIGRSDKPCWSRGRFGEGLDVAACFFLTKGCSVYIMSYDVAFRFILPESDIAVLIGKPKKECFGCTKVMVSGFGSMANKVSDIVFSGRVIASANISGYEMGVDCDYNAEDIIAEKSEYLGKLYVKGMLVNNFRAITGRNSIFDYNLWWTPLSRDRVHIGSIGDLYCEISQLLNECDNNVEIADMILDKVCKVGYTKSSRYYIFEGDFVEVQVISGMGFDSKFRNVITDRFLERYGLKADNTGVVGDAAFVDKYSYLGYNAVVNNLPVSGFILNLRSVDDLIAEDFEKFSKSAKSNHVWSVYDLKDAKFRSYIVSKYGVDSLVNTISAVNYSICMLSILGKGDVCIKLCDMSKMVGVGKGTIALYSRNDNSIYFGVDRMGDLWMYHLKPEDVGAEEVIHAVSGAGDVEVNFEKCLINYLNRFYSSLIKNNCELLGFLIGKTGKVLCNVDKYYNGMRSVCCDSALALYSGVGVYKGANLYVGHINIPYDFVIADGHGVIIDGINDFSRIVSECSDNVSNVVLSVTVDINDKKYMFVYFVYLSDESIDKMCLLGDYKLALKKIAEKVVKMEDNIRRDIEYNIGVYSNTEEVLDEAFSNAKLMVIGVDGNVVGGRLWELIE